MLNGRMRCINYSFVLRPFSPRGAAPLGAVSLQAVPPPLFIPWDSIRNVRRESVFFSRYAVFDVYGPEKLLTVRISERVLDSESWKARSS